MLKVPGTAATKRPSRWATLALSSVTLLGSFLVGGPASAQTSPRPRQASSNFSLPEESFGAACRAALVSTGISFRRYILRRLPGRILQVCWAYPLAATLAGAQLSSKTES
jgi:hypothetical protein